MSTKQKPLNIEFVDAPPGRSPDPERKAVERRFAAALKDHPSKWAKYPLPIPSGLAARALATRIRHGRQSSFGQGFEAAQRAGEVFVRWMGGDQ
jgi:hypothetical protein